MRIEDSNRCFEVTGHYYMKERGAFVIGNILRGEFKIGMKLPAKDENEFLTISSIEYLDNLAERKFWNALVFAEKPTFGYVEENFPVGMVIRL